MAIVTEPRFEFFADRQRQMGDLETCLDSAKKRRLLYTAWVSGQFSETQWFLDEFRLRPSMAPGYVLWAAHRWSASGAWRFWRQFASILEREESRRLRGWSRVRAWAR